METGEDSIVYRYFGTELRLVFYLASFFFLLVSILRFRSAFVLSLIFFLICILIALFAYLDYKSHLLILDEEQLRFRSLFGPGVESFSWKSIQSIVTSQTGIFDLLKATSITSGGKQIKVFSFMEDYYHFLKDICAKAKDAQIDKLTHDLVTGQADI